MTAVVVVVIVVVIVVVVAAVHTLAESSFVITGTMV